MKAKTALLAVGIFGALQAAVFAEGTNLTTSATEPKPQLQPIYPPVDYKLQLTKPGTETTGTDKITRLGPNSSLPWAEVAALQGNPTVFQDARKHEPKLVLLSLSFGSKPAAQLKLGQ